jgi:enoyl-CoA hydratase/carnithine racemase
MTEAYESIIYDLSDGVATITLNRPEVLNAFGGQMASELSAAFRRADADEAVRAVVLTGTPPAFCSGADLSEGATTFRKRDESSFSAGAIAMPPWDVRKPVIAAVNGHAVGIGFTLTLQCDIRIFASDAKYGIVQVRRGVMGDAYSHWTLPRIAGQSGAAEILLTGRPFDGARAKELGVCSQVVANDKVLPVALELARDIAATTAPRSVAASKALLWSAWELDRGEVERRETALHHDLMGHPDAHEGVLAYLERRAPRWTGTLADGFPHQGGA